MPNEHVFKSLFWLSFIWTLQDFLEGFPNGIYHNKKTLTAFDTCFNLRGFIGGRTFSNQILCCNPSLGLMTKAKVYKVVGQEEARE
jgi:hypothetical protein